MCLYVSNTLTCTCDLWNVICKRHVSSPGLSVTSTKQHIVFTIGGNILQGLSVLSISTDGRRKVLAISLRKVGYFLP